MLWMSELKVGFILFICCPSFLQTLQAHEVTKEVVDSIFPFLVRYRTKDWAFVAGYAKREEEVWSLWCCIMSRTPDFS